MFFIFFCLILCYGLQISHAEKQESVQERLDQGGLLSDVGIKLFGLRVSNAETFANIVNPILTPRVVGTPGHKAVREHIVGWMQLLNWQVELDTFVDQTPLGSKEFSNIVATLNPKSPKRLVLACHYDSKISDDGNFIGATDSAVPCAMMIQLALDLRTELEALRKAGSEVTLQFIFFDGEEAFVSWSDKDSIYGARHLAAKWEKTPYPQGSKPGSVELDRIDMLVLLDLLGARNPVFFSYMKRTDTSYQRLATIEEKLRAFRTIPQGVSKKKFFDRRVVEAGIQDDHIPFLERGVRILHLIPSPFPAVWHKNSDDGSAIHWQTVESLGRILRVFVAEYLGLQPLDRSP